MSLAFAGDRKPFASIADICQEFDLCRATVTSLISRGELRAFRVGKAIRVPYSELDALRERNAIRPDEAAR
jgi:excisionase family DNA binding protein